MSGQTFLRSTWEQKHQNFQNLKVDLKVALLFFVCIDCVEDLSSIDSKIVILYWLYVYYLNF